MFVKLLHPGAKLPTRSADSAGVDLYALEGGSVPPGSRRVIGTGISVALPKNTYGQILGRSGLAVRNGVAVLAGVVDNDYRGEIKIVLLNTGDEVYEYGEGEKVAQMVAIHYHPLVPVAVPELEDTERGGKGFGSSGRF